MYKPITELHINFWIASLTITLINQIFLIIINTQTHQICTNLNNIGIMAWILLNISTLKNLQSSVYWKMIATTETIMLNQSI